MNEPDMYREWAPPPSWRAVVCCWEQRVDRARIQRVVPDGHADLLVYETGEKCVVGVHDQVAFPELDSGTRLRGFRLRPAAVAKAFGVPAFELRNVTVPVDAVLSDRTTRRLDDPQHVDAWLRSVEADVRVDQAIRLLQTLTVAATAEAVGLTERHLRRLLLEHAGVSPKTIQRVQRFQRFVRAADAGTALAAAAAEARYADQSHLTREVVVLAGVTPGALVAERRNG